MNNQAGEKLYKKVLIRIIPPEGHKEERQTVKAPARSGFNAGQMDGVLESVADYLEKKYPHWEFRMAQAGPNKFNFIYAGLRETPTEIASAPERVEPIAASA